MHEKPSLDTLRGTIDDQLLPLIQEVGSAEAGEKIEGKISDLRSAMQSCWLQLLVDLDRTRIELKRNPDADPVLLIAINATRDDLWDIFFKRLSERGGPFDPKALEAAHRDIQLLPIFSPHDFVRNPQKPKLI